MPFAELGERRVYYEEHGEGEPVLLINGLGADHRAWQLQTESLAREFRVIVFDNPGVGQTSSARRWAA
jgi:pimeloyl-ACP methyl ester carboxylesterase